MRTGIIEAVTKDGKHVVLANSSVALPLQKAMFKTARENNAKVDDVQFVKIVHFVSNAKVRVLHYRKPQPKIEAPPEGFVANIPALCDAVGLKPMEFNKLRDEHTDSFPGKADEGYDVAAVQAWVDAVNS